MEASCATSAIHFTAAPNTTLYNIYTVYQHYTVDNVQHCTDSSSLAYWTLQYIVQSKVLVVCRVVVVAPDAERTEQPGKALLLSNSAPTALPDAGEQLYTGV